MQSTATVHNAQIQRHELNDDVLVGDGANSLPLYECQWDSRRWLQHCCPGVCTDHTAPPSASSCSSCWAEAAWPGSSLAAHIYEPQESHKQRSGVEEKNIIKLTWSLVWVSPQYRLHKHTQSFYVNPCDEGLAEIHLQPSYQRPLDWQVNCQ